MRQHGGLHTAKDVTLVALMTMPGSNRSLRGLSPVQAVRFKLFWAVLSFPTAPGTPASLA